MPINEKSKYSDTHSKRSSYAYSIRSKDVAKKNIKSHNPSPSNKDLKSDIDHSVIVPKHVSLRIGLLNFRIKISVFCLKLLTKW